jgi:hypothetical protein
MPYTDNTNVKKVKRSLVVDYEHTGLQFSRWLF